MVLFYNLIGTYNDWFYFLRRLRGVNLKKATDSSFGCDQVEI